MARKEAAVAVQDLRRKASDTLAGKIAQTVVLQKSGKVTYRARFAGFDETGARAASPSTASAAADHERPLAISQADAQLQWGDCPAIFPPGCKLTVLHGAPDQPGADVFLRVPAGYTIPAGISQGNHPTAVSHRSAKSRAGVRGRRPRPARPQQPWRWARQR